MLRTARSTTTTTTTPTPTTAALQATTTTTTKDELTEKGRTNSGGIDMKGSNNSLDNDIENDDDHDDHDDNKHSSSSSSSSSLIKQIRLRMNSLLRSVDDDGTTTTIVKRIRLRMDVLLRTMENHSYTKCIMIRIDLVLQSVGGDTFLNSLTEREKILLAGSALFCTILFFGYLVSLLLLSTSSLSSSSSSSSSGALSIYDLKKDSTGLFQQYSKSASPCHPLSSRKDVHFTLVTQTSDDRMWLMKHQCDLWQGPISVAIYTDRSQQEIEQVLQNDLGCTIGTKHVTVQTMSTGSGGSSNTNDMYPVNALRNLALSAVYTSHISIIDIDFWPSENLYSTLESPLFRQAMYKDDKLAFVIPAFQADPGLDWCRKGENCHDKLIKFMPRNKQALSKGMTQRVLIKRKTRKTFASQYSFLIQPFQFTIHAAAHNSTNYDQWYTQAPGTLHPIPCVVSDMYEPYLALRYCQKTPPFQDVFTGYGQNKISWILQLRKAGYALSQIGGAFVTHFPHEESTSKERWKDHPAQMTRWWEKPQDLNVPADQLKDYHRGKMDRYLVQFQQWLEETYPSSLSSSSSNKGSAVEVRTGRCENWIDASNRLWVY